VSAAAGAAVSGIATAEGGAKRSSRDANNEAGKKHDGSHAAVEEKESRAVSGKAIP
jgi:hypothetical protein